MDYFIYLDESGDLGWTFDKPYRSGGSSRYLTIGYIIIPAHKRQFAKRIVKKSYEKFKWPTGIEKKATDLNEVEKNFICDKVLTMADAHPDVIIGSITVKKENVEVHIRKDTNIIYNFMIRLSVLPKIKGANTVRLVRDERSIKVASGNSCADYLRATLFFDMKSKTDLVDAPIKSHLDHGVMLSDWICNFIWKRFEDKQTEQYFKLLPCLKNTRLFHKA